MTEPFTKTGATYGDGEWLCKPRRLKDQGRTIARADSIAKPAPCWRCSAMVAAGETMYWVKPHNAPPSGSMGPKP